MNTKKEKTPITGGESVPNPNHAWGLAPDSQGMFVLPGGGYNTANYSHGGGERASNPSIIVGSGGAQAFIVPAITPAQAWTEYQKAAAEVESEKKEFGRKEMIITPGFLSFAVGSRSKAIGRCAFSKI